MRERQTHFTLTQPIFLVSFPFTYNQLVRSSAQTPLAAIPSNAVLRCKQHRRGVHRHLKRRHKGQCAHMIFMSMGNHDA